MTQPSGPQFVMRTDIGLPERGMVGVNSGASAMTRQSSSKSCACAAAIELFRKIFQGHAFASDLEPSYDLP